jgi:hypothetical protein
MSIGLFFIISVIDVWDAEIDVVVDVVVVVVDIFFCFNDDENRANEKENEN